MCVVSASGQHNGTPAVRQVVSVGGRIVLDCYSLKNQTVIWYKWEKGEQKYVVDNDIIQNGYVDRFNISNTSKNDHSLVIERASTSDAGHYQCIEDLGQGRKHDYDLHVES